MEARVHRGRWLVRIEDLDPPREEPGAADQILRTLEAYGLTWDGSVRYQSQHHADYQAALNQLIQQGRAYPCRCSRKQLAAAAAYPGFCRHLKKVPKPPYAWRFRVTEAEVRWTDGLQGVKQVALESLGDPVILRKDGYWAYQLAVVTDDLDQGVTHVVRGIDLMDSTPWQLDLAHCLANQVSIPFQYTHLPVIVNSQGQKLSKQNKATPLCHERPSEVLYRVLRALGQTPDPQWIELHPEALLTLAQQHWSIAPLRGEQTIDLASL